jgi:hypothetical protein
VKKRGKSDEGGAVGSNLLSTVGEYGSKMERKIPNHLTDRFLEFDIEFCD